MTTHGQQEPEIKMAELISRIFPPVIDSVGYSDTSFSRFGIDSCVDQHNYVHLTTNLGEGPFASVPIWCSTCRLSGASNEMCLIRNR